MDSSGNGRNGHRGKNLLSALFLVGAQTTGSPCSDARVVADFYRTRRGSRTVYIPYGASPSITLPGNTLDQLGLSPDGYLLYVSRLEPRTTQTWFWKRTGPQEVSSVFRCARYRSDAPYATDYRPHSSYCRGDAWRDHTGYLFGEAYAELQSQLRVYIQATEVGGTHPALVEAMARAPASWPGRARAPRSAS